MKEIFRRFSVVLTVLFFISQGVFLAEAWAKAPRRSFGSRKKSLSSTPTSPSKGSSFNLSQQQPTHTITYSSRSKTRDTKGSIFHAYAQKTSRGTSLVQAAQRAESKSKFTATLVGKQTSQTYRQVVSEHAVLREFLTTKHTFTRQTRRTAFYRAHSPVNDSYYRYSSTAYADPYDNLFFRYATLTWLFHHWETIDTHRFDDRQLRELEARLAQLEHEGLERDPEYTMPGVDRDLQYADEELGVLQDTQDVMEFEFAVEETEGGFAWVTMFLIALVVVGGVYVVGARKISREQ